MDYFILYSKIERKMYSNWIEILYDLATNESICRHTHSVMFSRFALIYCIRNAHRAINYFRKNYTAFYQYLMCIEVKRVGCIGNYLELRSDTGRYIAPKLSMLLGLLPNTINMNVDKDSAPIQCHFIICTRKLCNCCCCCHC